MRKKTSYVEGDKARENFERFASAILQVPKAGMKRRTAETEKKSTARKKHGSGKG